MAGTAQAKAKVAKRRVSSVKKVSKGRAASSGSPVKANPKSKVVSPPTKKVATTKSTKKKVAAKKSRAETHGTKKSPIKMTMKPATMKVPKRPRVFIEACKGFRRSAAKLASELDERGISSEVNAVKPRKGNFVVTLEEKSTEIVSLFAMPRPFKKLRDLDLVDVAERIERALSE